MVEQWNIFEATLTGPADGNPYKDAELTADFSNGEETVRVNGFYCGNGSYKIRFMPGKPGLWRAVTRSNVPALDGVELTCECAPAGAGNHGRVLLKSQVIPPAASVNPEEDKFHFAYEDGTRFHPFGTTCYAWTHQSAETQERTLEVLRHSPFNKVRMCIFPKYYTFNTTDPDCYPFEGNREDGFDFTRFNEDYWKNLEHRIAQLDEAGIQADIILFHPYDRWGFATMSRETNLFYLRYAVDRLCHFKNVWWSLANEYDLMKEKSIEDWERFARVVMNRDCYGHLRSIHNCMLFYDFTRPWITHCSIQRVEVYKTAEYVPDWREIYQKPVVVDECAYEGNMNFGWGNITGKELVRRFWEGCVRGGYLSHGECYVDRGPEIWWSHGGVLYGDAPARIAFLKDVISGVPETATPVRVTLEEHMDFWDSPCIRSEGEYYLYYFSFFQPAFRDFELPEDKKFRIDVIDTWNMTVTALPGTYSGITRVKLPGRQYMAVRIRAVNA